MNPPGYRGEQQTKSATSPEVNTITTANLLEIAYLLDRRHRITGVTTKAGWPCGIEELAVTLEGENIDLDHRSFLHHGEFQRHRLPSIAKAFAAVMAVMDSSAEEAAFESDASGGVR